MGLRAGARQKLASLVGQASANVLCCQWVTGDSSVEGTALAAERSLPDMSLAFALAAAINGSAGSRATLSCGLDGTKPRRRQSGGAKDSHRSWVATQAARATVL